MRTTTWCLSFALILAACGSSASDAPDVEADGTQSAGAGGQQAYPGPVGSAGASEAGGSSGTSGSNAVGAAGIGGSSGLAGTPSGGAGAGGSPAMNDGGPPHVVAACPTGDVAPGQLGVWEDITPIVLRTSKAYTPTGAILVDPKDSRTVYAGSEGSGLFKSTDCGATFVHISTGTNGSHISSGRMWDMIIDPVDPSILYSVEGYGDGGLWKTANGGVDWINTTPADSEVGKTANGNFTSIVGMDVTNHLHLVVAFHSGCSGAYAPNCQAESTDGGQTWRLFKTPIAGEGVGVIVLGPKTWVANGWQDVEETTDGGASWKKVSGVTAHWQLYQSPKSGAFFIGSEQGIIKSTNGTDWTMLPGFAQPVQGIAGDGTDL